jgi:hypothetical protein
VYGVKINKCNEQGAWLILLLFRQGSRKTGRLENMGKRVWRVSTIRIGQGEEWIFMSHGASTRRLAEREQPRDLHASVPFLKVETLSRTMERHVGTIVIRSIDRQLLRLRTPHFRSFFQPFMAMILLRTAWSSKFGTSRYRV